jgi:hypothetical protein
VVALTDVEVVVALAKFGLVALLEVKVVVELAKFGLVALLEVKVVVVLAVDRVALRYHCEMLTVALTGFLWLDALFVLLLSLTVFS